jgi:hypothetical protein
MREILGDLKKDTKVQMLSFDDFSVNTGTISYEECGSWGTVVFWHSLSKLLCISKEERSKLYLTVVKEPGKARTVTKSLILLRVVLDTISKICSKAL